MRRNLADLSNQIFDVLVIGGGIQGACIAWEATLRGLSVALVEQADFASGTSANSLKVIHGGLRYLQTADFQRMRQSIRARQTLMRIAPHLVHPMPVLVPTYGHGTKGKEALAVALKMNDLISCDRNFPLSDPQKHIPTGQILSKQACLRQLPDLPTEGLTGAARFHDAQVYNSEQLVLSFLESAFQRGAQIANYVRVTDVLRKSDHVIGATLQDQIEGSRFDIRARKVINASGPWLNALIARTVGKPEPKGALTKAMNLVTRSLFGPQQEHAIGITGRAPGSRLFFIAPWRGKSMVGTWYGPDNEGSKPPLATSDEMSNFLQDINKAYPTFNLTPDDVEWVHSGLLPSDGIQPAQNGKPAEMKLTKHFQLTDHKCDGFEGLMSVSAVKYTTAGDVAKRVVDWVFRSDGRMVEASLSHKTPLQGGAISQFQTFLNDAIEQHRGTIPAQTIQRLVYNYGSEYTAVLNELKRPTQSPDQSVSSYLETPDKLTDHDAIAAEVRYSLKNTMPHTLCDIVFRRTELGAAGHPGNEAIQQCADVMAQAQHWSPERKRLEIAQVQQQLYRHSPATQPTAHPAQPCPV